MTDVGLGLPKSKWHTDEYQRRIEHRFEFRADRSEIVVIYPDGKTQELSVPLFLSTHILQSKSVRLASEIVPLADAFIGGFSIRIPAVFIDGERIEIPAIQFLPDEEKFLPVINC